MGRFVVLALLLSGMTLLADTASGLTHRVQIRSLAAGSSLAYDHSTGQPLDWRHLSHHHVGGQRLARRVNSGYWVPVHHEDKLDDTAWSGEREHHLAETKEKIWKRLQNAGNPISRSDFGRLVDNTKDRWSQRPTAKQLSHALGSATQRVEDRGAIPAADASHMALLAVSVYFKASRDKGKWGKWDESPTVLAGDSVHSASKGPNTLQAVRLHGKRKAASVGLENDETIGRGPPGLRRVTGQGM